MKTDIEMINLNKVRLESVFNKLDNLDCKEINREDLENLVDEMWSDTKWALEFLKYLQLKNSNISQ